MSVQALAWVFDHSPTTKSDRLALLSLANHAGPDLVDDDDGTQAWEAYPGVDTIAREGGLARRRTAQDALTRLVEAGHVSRVINGAPDNRIRGDQRPNLYRIRIANGVSCGDTRCGWCIDRDGVTRNAERGDAKRRDGVTRNDATGCRSASPEVVIEPSVEPSVEPLTFVETTAGPVLDFDAFWSVYPRRVDKGGARGAWAAAIKKAPPAEIIAGAERYRDDPNRDDTFTAHPRTWLRGERWDDPPMPPRSVHRGAPPPEQIDDDRGGFEGVVDL